jgi:choline-phosphate cytidylyltransferase
MCIYHLSFYAHATFGVHFYQGTAIRERIQEKLTKQKLIGLIYDRYYGDGDGDSDSDQYYYDDDTEEEYSD